MVDDDMRIMVKDIDFTFSMWRRHPFSIVGNFPRFHRQEATVT